MESEVLSEKVQREIRRVATAFRVQEWRVGNQINPSRSVGCVAKIEALSVFWYVNVESTDWTFIDICLPSVNGPGCRVWCEASRDPNQWFFYPNTKFSELMARGLYRLGFEDEDVLAELNHPLTAHEKLELRLSMPREFWPQKWLDKEAQ